MGCTQWRCRVPWDDVVGSPRVVDLCAFTAQSADDCCLSDCFGVLPVSTTVVFTSGVAHCLMSFVARDAPSFIVQSSALDARSTNRHSGYVPLSCGGRTHVASQRSLLCKACTWVPSCAGVSERLHMCRKVEALLFLSLSHSCETSYH